MTPEEIQSFRLSLGVSQERFAHLLGTTVVTVNRWENGKTKPSRLYVKEIKELRNSHGKHIHRRKESENS